MRLVRDHQEDLQEWDSFLASYNGRYFWLEQAIANFDIELFTDAAGSACYLAYCQGQWNARCWPAEWRELGLVRNLAAMELFPIVFFGGLWGKEFSNRRVRFHCDNLGECRPLIALRLLLLLLSACFAT